MRKKCLLRVVIRWKCQVMRGRRFWREVVDYHVVKEGKDHDEIRLRGFGFNLFCEDEEGVGRNLLSEYPYY